MDNATAIRTYQQRHGPDLALFLNSPLWRATRALLIEHTPSRRLPMAATPHDILTLGVVYAANDQGYHDAIGFMESLAEVQHAAMDPTLNPTYEPEFEPAQHNPPPPAPEAPLVEKPKHRKAKK